MKVSEIMSELEYYDGTFPLQALKVAIANRDEIIPELLKVLEYATKHMEELLDEPEYMAHLYAMYLLAQFREERAYPLFIELFSTPGKAIQELSGDVVTEDLGRMLASICGGDVEAIKGLAENEQANEYVRSAALQSLIVLFAQGVKTREEILAYFQSLFREKIPRDDELIWYSLVSLSTKLYPDVLYDDIKQAFADDLIDPMFIDLKYVDDDMRRGKEHALEATKADHHNTFIEDTILEMETWAAFKPSKPVKALPLVKKGSGQVVREGRKIGRNEPCPCGSGLKYKKCCVRRG